MANNESLQILAKEIKTLKGQYNLLREKVDNLKKDKSMIELRFEQLEKNASEFYDNVRSQMVELFSSVESAREMLDEISGGMEEESDYSADDEESEDVELVDPGQEIPGEDVEFDPDILNVESPVHPELNGLGLDMSKVVFVNDMDMDDEDDEEEEDEDEEEDDDYEYTDVAGQPHAKNEFI